MVLIAVALGFFADARRDAALKPPASLAAAVTGSTDRLSGADALGDLQVNPTAGREEPSRQQWLDLLPKLKALVMQSPDDVSAKRKLALAYYNLGEFPEAVEIYGALLAGGEDAVLRDRLGNTLRDMGDPAGAEAAYRRAIADDPTLAPPYLNLAELVWRLGRNDEALTILDDGLSAVSTDARSVLEKARQLLVGEGEGPTTSA